MHDRSVFRPVVVADGGGADVTRRGRRQMLAWIGGLCRLLRAQPFPEDAQRTVSTFVVSGAIGSPPS
jgi:hypothetical protein